MFNRNVMMRGFWRCSTYFCDPLLKHGQALPTVLATLKHFCLSPSWMYTTCIILSSLMDRQTKLVDLFTFYALGTGENRQKSAECIKMCKVELVVLNFFCCKKLTFKSVKNMQKTNIKATPKSLSTMLQQTGEIFNLSFLNKVHWSTNLHFVFHKI